MNIRNTIITIFLLLLLTQNSWSRDPIFYLHPVRLAYGLASENDIPKGGVIAQNNEFLWLKFGLEIPLHNNRSFLITPKFFSRQFNLEAKEYHTAILNKQRNQCIAESKVLESCNKYTKARDGVETANNHLEFELGLEWRWYNGRDRQGYFQKFVGIAGLGYYEADSYGLIDDGYKVKQDNSIAAIGAAMYGIGFETVSDFFAFTFDSAFGIQMAGPFPEYYGESQLPLAQDLFRGEINFAFGFEL